ncbi:hypothetical protein [Nocardia sp. NPDC049526]|uniref:hypothetical protein n=1 Tax=Nocardia sp. NPDC049526 TaxID=3364316 RepID=UPI00378CDD99
MVFPARNRDIALQPTIDHDGKALTLRPIDDPAVDPQPTTSAERWNQEVQRASFGALIGAGIGLIIGLPLGGIILFPIPMATTAIGAGIGFLAVGGQPLIDAGHRLLQRPALIGPISTNTSAAQRNLALGR